MLFRSNGGRSGLYMPAVKVGQPIAEFEREVVLPRNTELKFRGEDYYPMGDGNFLTYYRFERVTP